MHELTQYQEALEYWEEIKSDPSSYPEACARFCEAYVPYLIAIIELCEEHLQDAAKIRRDRDQKQRLIEQDIYTAGGQYIE